MFLCRIMSCFILWFSREKGAALVSKLGKNAEFVEVNIESTNMLENTLEGEFESLSFFLFFFAHSSLLLSSKQNIHSTI